MSQDVVDVWKDLHALPEIGFQEVKTSAYLADALRQAGFTVRTGLGGTGVTGTLAGAEPGPTVALRADMDALAHLVDGQAVAIHSCGHDAHSAMVLSAAREAAKRGIARGTLKILFQPAEELLTGAPRMIDDGAVDDVDTLIGLHLRPIHEAGLGQATPALYHGASAVYEVILTGKTAHGARPHLGINVIDAAAAVVNAVNAIRIVPTVASSAKATKIQAGGAANNAIPDTCRMVFDLRSQQNAVMEELVEKFTRAVKAGAATVGASAEVNSLGDVPAAQYSQPVVDLAREAITAVLGEKGLLGPIVTPGGEDFHFFVKRKPSLQVGYLGLGCDLRPGLHDPAMSFDTRALQNGVDILLHMVERLTRA